MTNAQFKTAIAATTRLDQEAFNQDASEPVAVYRDGLPEEMTVESILDAVKDYGGLGKQQLIRLILMCDDLLTATKLWSWTRGELLAYCIEHYAH